MKKSKADRVSEMQPEYDFSGGVRGKYAARATKGSNLVVLDADVARVFRDSASVNRALRSLIDLARRESPRSRPRSA